MEVSCIIYEAPTIFESKNAFKEESIHTHTPKYPIQKTNNAARLLTAKRPLARNIL